MIFSHPKWWYFQTPSDGLFKSQVMIFSHPKLWYFQTPSDGIFKPQVMVFSNPKWWHFQTPKWWYFTPQVMNISWLSVCHFSCLTNPPPPFGPMKIIAESPPFLCCGTSCFWCYILVPPVYCKVQAFSMIRKEMRKKLQKYRNWSSRLLSFRKKKVTENFFVWHFTLIKKILICKATRLDTDSHFVTLKNIKIFTKI